MDQELIVFGSAVVAVLAVPTVLALAAIAWYSVLDTKQSMRSMDEDADESSGPSRS